MRRESYSNRFATALAGVDIDNPGTALDRSGHPNPVPRVVGPIERMHPVQVRDVEFLRANTSRRIKVTVPGPFTMSQQAQNDVLRDRCGARARLRGGGATTRSSTSSPPVRTSSRSTSRTCRRAPRRHASIGLAALERALDGVVGHTAVHICFGYAAIIHERPSAYSFLPELAATSGEADLDRDRPIRSRHLDPGVAPGQADHPRGDQPRRHGRRVARDRRRAHPPRAALQAAGASSSRRPDCGMKYLPRDVAFGKLESLVAGAAIVRAETAAGS